MEIILTYFIVYQLAVLQGDQTYLKEMYAQIGNEVVLSCEISKETSTQIWRKDLTLVSQGFEINRSIRGHERRHIITDQKFYNLKIYNITEHDFGTYWCERQQGKSIRTDGTRLIHSDQTSLKEMYAQIGNEVVLSCEILKETSTKSWRKDLTRVTQGCEINRSIRGHERRHIITDQKFYNLKIYNITEHDFGTYWCEKQQANSMRTDGTRLIHSVIVASTVNPYEETSTVTSTTNVYAETTTDRQRTSFQSTLSDSSTSETKDGTSMHVGKRLFNGLFVTGFALLCLSICGNCFFDKLRAAFTRRKKRRSDDSEN